MSTSMDLFKKLMVDVWVDETVNNSTSFQISISKRLDCFDAVLAKDKSSNILNEKDERDQPLLFSFLHSIIKFISKCLPLKQTTTTVESQEGVKMHGDAETVKYLEACGNAFKIIVATLKPRLRLSINSPSWLPICDSLLAASTLILRQKSIPKDCVTSAAMTFVSALYIRASYSGDGSNNSVNQRSNLDDCLHSLLILVDDSGDISQLNILIKSTNLNTTETHVPVHPSGQSLSMLIKCAITRSIISVFDDDILCPLLLQPPIFSTLTEWCSEPLPEMRQYVLQTLSTLLDRLGTLLSNMTYCGSLLRLSLDIESHLRHLGSLLIASWTHPSRQVNHTVSGVYEKVLALMRVIRSKRAASGVTLVVSDDEYWSDFVSDALSLPAQNRARYQAIANLLPVVGAGPFIRSHSSLVAHLINECRTRDVCAPCVALVVAFLRQLHAEQVSVSERVTGDTVIDSTVTQSKVTPTLPATESSKKSKNKGKDENSNNYSINQILADDPVKQSLRVSWDSALVEVLCSSDEHTRNNASSFLVPEILTFDPLSGPHIVSIIHSRKATVLSTTGKFEHLLWGLLSVCFHARQQSFPGKDISFTPTSFPTQNDSETQSIATVSADDVKIACVSEDASLRLLALNTLTSCHQTTTAIDKRELEIIQQSIGYSLKVSQADDRQHVLRALNTLLSRMYEGYRIAVREKKRMTQRIVALERDLNALASKTIDNTATSATDNANTETILLLKVSESQIVISECDEQVQNFDIFCQWLRDEVCQHLAPDISADKELMCLEVLNAIFDHPSNILDTASAATITYASYFYKDSVVSAILSLLQSKIDRSRITASELLLKFPQPLPGYQKPTNINLILAKACELTGSAKQRESESGALFFKFIYFVYAVNLKWAVAAPMAGEDSIILNSVDRMDSFLSVDTTQPPSSVAFIHRLVDLLESRLSGLSTVFEQLGDINNYIYQLSLVKEGLAPSNNTTTAADMNTIIDTNKMESPSLSSSGLEALCHGLVMSIRFCLEKIALAAADQLLSSNDIHHWRALFHRVLLTTSRAMTIAMNVVAEAKSDEPFAVEPNIASTKGPINSATASSNAVGKVNSMAATYVNTNSLMGAASEGEEEGAADASSGAQRAVVAAWLLVKEACSLLASLVDISCGVASIDVSINSSRGLKSAKSNKYRIENTDTSSIIVEALLSADDVSFIGAAILDALGRLKHMGAIFEAQQALQKVCEAIFRQRDQSDVICRLPSQWLNSLLSRLDNHLQVFILRRSAGFAYSFTAILRAEFTKPKTLVPIALNALLRSVEAGLLTDSSQRTVTGNNKLIDAAAVSEEQVVIEQLEGLNTEQWRMSVHALNVLRLILADAILGPDLDPFLSHATELSIRGFRSTKWAVRNSSMMMFASVIQRTIDNEKHDSGGSKATSVVDFFGRFPSLFPFLLRELAFIAPSLLHDSTPKDIETMHPSLYPILLLLSKLRSAVFRAELRLGSSIDYTALIPFIQLCSHHRVMKIRQIAAKALCSLTALEAVAEKAKELLLPLVDILSSGKYVYNNHVHGRLMLVYEVLDGFRRHNDRLGSTAAVVTIIEQCEGTLVQPLEKLATFIFMKDSFYYRCAAIQSVFLNILCCLYELSSSHTKYLLFAELLMHSSSEIIKSLFDLSLAPKQPYIAVLRRSGIDQYTRLSLARDIAVNSGQDNSLKAGVIPLEKLYTLLGHAVSEVREGVLLGVEYVLSAMGTGQLNTVQSSLGNYILKSVSFQTLVARLLLRSGQEKEPPISALTLSVLSRITQEAKLSAYSEAVVLRFHQSWESLSSLIIDKGTSVPETFVLTSSCIRPTITATYTIQLLGWIMESVLTSPSTALDTRLLHSAHWLDILEAASEETQSAHHRLACARSAAFSHALPYLLQRAISSTNGQNSANVANGSVGNNIGANDAYVVETLLSGLCIRLWLVVLSLLEDDDKDVRSEANSILSDVIRTVNLSSLDILTINSNTTSNEDKLNISNGTKTRIATVEAYTLAQLAPYLSICISWRVQLSVSQDPVLQLLLDRVQWGLGDIDAAESFIAEYSRDQVGTIAQTKIFEAEPTNLYEEPLHHSLLLVRSLLHAVQRINTKNNSDTPSPAAVALFNLLRTTLTDCSRGLELLTHILVNPLASILSKLAIGVTYDPVLFTPLYGRLQVLRLILAASEIHDCDDLLRQQIDTLKQSKDKVLSTLASSNTFDHRLHPLLLKCLS